MNHTIITDYKYRYERVSRELLNTYEIPALHIKTAIYYVLFPGGTLLRPLLVYLCGELFELDVPILDVIATAVELINCASIVHDDLPAMDDDEFRRSRLCCHLAFDEATAILVGDGMQMLAIDLLLTHLNPLLPSSKILTITQVLSRASGVMGMVSGQSLDLSSLDNNPVTVMQLQQIHDLKAGKLISACIDMVLAAADCSVPEANALKAFARDFGILFQIHNDYLDCYGNMHLSGKKPASDHKNQKTTYANLYDENYLQKMFKKESEAMAQQLSVFGKKSSHLLILVKELLSNQLHKLAPFSMGPKILEDQD